MNMEAHWELRTEKSAITAEKETKDLGPEIPKNKRY